jgi:hypothetical protein
LAGSTERWQAPAVSSLAGTPPLQIHHPGGVSRS